MRFLYSLAWYLALPLVLLRLWWRGRKEPGYRQHIGERFGCYAPLATADYAGHAGHVKLPPPVIWLHAVSVGETRAAEPLINALLLDYPACTILLTHMTPTGRETGHMLFARHGARLVQSYLPYDTGITVRRFLRHFAPRICILMETEVWPNLVAQCARRLIPVALVNARLSQRSLAKAQRLSGLLGAAAQALTCVAAQTEPDAARIQQLGAPAVHVTGSIKFDVTPPASALHVGATLRARIGARPVLLCASTREGEEEMILDAFAALTEAGGKGKDGDLTAGLLPSLLPGFSSDLSPLLLLVPRHPQRFDQVAQMIAARGMLMQRRSLLSPDADAIPAQVQVLLGDSMGEMFAYCHAADIAFIGGSLLPLGGQNLIEACALGKPVLIGPHTFNFELVTNEAIEAGAALRVADGGDLMRQARQLLQADASEHGQRAQMGRNAQAFALQHRGATARTMALLADLLAQGDGAGRMP
jgi:3-deoxy-D-manno-octulosonic-acid transferase